MPRHAALRSRLLGVLAGLAVVGIVALVPDLATPRQDPHAPVVTAFRGRIETIGPSAPSSPDVPSVPVANVRALDGPQAGELVSAYLTGPGGSQAVAGYRPGDEVVVTVTQSPDAGEPFVAVSDRWRMPWLGGLGLLFAAAVIVVGGWHGVRALIALGLTIAVILKILLPLVITGVPPVPLAVLTASGVTVVTILLTEGARRSSVAAILGTTASLAITGLLAAAATSVMGFTYAAGSDLAFLATQGGQGLDLRGVLLAAFILGAVGVLDDVTVTQAVLVDELSAKAGLAGRSLVASAMAVGRSHIAATVNTLFLAYVGAGLPLLVVLLVSAQPMALVLNDETIATEIVRTIVGSLGIIAAVPLTTFIAASLATSGAPRVSATDDPGATDARHLTRRANRTVLVSIAAVLVLLGATAALPLTSGTRSALAPPVFDPDASLVPDGGSARPSGPGVDPGSGDDAGAGDEPQIADIGEPVAILVDGQVGGRFTVLTWTREPGPGPGDRVQVTVEYRAVRDLPVATGSWSFVLEDGSDVSATVDPAVAGRTLASGEALEVMLEGEIPAAEPPPFLFFFDDAGDVGFGVGLG